MKKEWVRPQTLIESFAANEYIAACGDSGKVYKFECNAGTLFGPGGNVWLETNNKEGLQRYSDQDLGGYHRCGETHKAESTDKFLSGYYSPYFSDEVVDVIVWRGPNGNNTHCTTNLDMTTWETAKS